VANCLGNMSIWLLKRIKNASRKVVCTKHYMHSLSFDISQTSLC
jgi:hypothetical protein